MNDDKFSYISNVNAVARLLPNRLNEQLEADGRICRQTDGRTPHKRADRLSSKIALSAYWA